MLGKVERCDGCGIDIAPDEPRIYRNAIHTGLMMKRGLVTHTNIECQRKRDNPPAPRGE